MIVSVFLSRPNCAFDIFAAGKRINHGGEYLLDIRANFHFYEPEKAIKLAKNQNNKDQIKLKRNCKALSKVNYIQFFCKNVSYGLLLGV